MEIMVITEKGAVVSAETFLNSIRHLVNPKTFTNLEMLLVGYPSQHMGTMTVLTTHEDLCVLRNDEMIFLFREGFIEQIVDKK